VGNVPRQIAVFLRKAVRQMDNRASGLWRRRVILFSATLGTVTCFIVIVAMTWAILYIHKDRSHLRRVAARIVSVNSSKRSAFGRGIHFGAYSLTVRYRTPDAEEVTDWLDEKTFGFPSKGESLTLLIDPESGRIEASPFPELWIILAAVYAGLGWLIWFFITVAGARPEFVTPLP
jgi:hypothetical protein